MDQQQEPEKRIEAALKGVTRDLNAGQMAKGKTLEDQRRALAVPRHHNEGLPHFVQLSRQLGEALIEIAQQQVTRAQNNLEDVTRWSESMQAEAQRKWEEMQTMERKFEDYRSHILQANDRFSGDKK